MKVMMVIARRAQTATIMRIVKDIDERAFITEAPVRGVYGEGFDVNYVKSTKKSQQEEEALSTSSASEETEG